MNEQIVIADGTFTPQQLARVLASYSMRGEWHVGEGSTNILEWVQEGDYSGDETLDSLAAEWDGDYIAEQRAAAAALGRAGGRISTPAKAQAARENGKRGGRPRKTQE